MAGDGTRQARWQGDLRLAAFLGVAYAWLLRGVDPSRTYYGAGLTSMPGFSIDPMYRRAHLTTIGGSVAWLGDWLSHWLARPAAGAAVLVAVAGLAAVATDCVVRAIAGRRLPGWRYAPAALCIVLDGHYLHALDWQLGWAAALFWAAACLWYAPRGLPARLAVIVPGQALLYYLVGGPAVPAALLMALGETRRPGGKWLAPSLLAWQALLPWASTWGGFDRPLANAYRELALPLWPNDAYGVGQAVSLAVPAFALLLGALAVSAAQTPPRPPRPALAWLGCAALCALLPQVAQDRVQGLRLEIAAQAARHDWDAVLAAADSLQPQELTHFETYQVLLALAHTGRVGERLFCYPTQPYSLLWAVDPRLAAQKTTSELRTQFGQLLGGLELELGFVNNAEHELHETLETQGTYPRLLVPMARIQVMLGRPKAAAVYARLAAAQPGDPAGGAALLAGLRLDPTLAGDPEQGALAEHRLRADIHEVHTMTGRLEQLVAEHPDHALAREYLLAWYLLSHQIDSLVPALPKPPAGGGEGLPRHFEEAALVWELLHGEPADIGGWRIRYDTRRRFEQFAVALGCRQSELADLLRTPNRPDDNACRLWRGPWRDTYYYYRLFGLSERAP